MHKFMMRFSYDGSQFSGYQKQPNKRTVQTEIEGVLSRILDKEVKLIASGRTDAGVHANGQIAHFVTESKMNGKSFKKALNSLLTSDIYIKEVARAENSFHARFNAKKKTYLYKINIGEFDVFNRNYEFQYNRELDVKKMKKAIKYLIGEHDFKSFSKADEKKDYIRTIYKASITRKKDIITIKFTGNGFLRYMVRNMVGTLIEIGEHKKKPVDIKTILEAKDRRKAGPTASPVGLYLHEVVYK